LRKLRPWANAGSASCPCSGRFLKQASPAAPRRLHGTSTSLALPGDQETDWSNRL
jgi:hypothetical protein